MFISEYNALVSYVGNSIAFYFKVRCSGGTCVAFMGSRIFLAHLYKINKAKMIES